MHMEVLGPFGACLSLYATQGGVPGNVVRSSRAHWSGADKRTTGSGSNTSEVVNFLIGICSQNEKIYLAANAISLNIYV